jgi:hypothetical protein
MVVRLCSSRFEVGGDAKRGVASGVSSSAVPETRPPKRYEIGSREAGF